MSDAAATETLSPGSWLTAKAWLDPDGTHVWVAHDCATERVTCMLPWPTWHSEGLGVVPSFSCEGCGVHTMLALGVPDEAYRCMDTFEWDGRWCERMVDHSGLHVAGMTTWAMYERPVTP